MVLTCTFSAERHIILFRTTGNPELHFIVPARGTGLGTQFTSVLKSTMLIYNLVYIHIMDAKKKLHGVS